MVRAWVASPLLRERGRGLRHGNQRVLDKANPSLSSPLSEGEATTTLAN